MLVPETLTVLRGDEAQLTCSTSCSQWTVMVWLLNAEVVLTISNESGLLPSVNSNVTAEQRSGNSWTFILKNSTRLNQGQVTCDLQGIGRRSADLFVEGVCWCVVTGDTRNSRQNGSATLARAQARVSPVTQPATAVPSPTPAHPNLPVFDLLLCSSPWCDTSEHVYVYLQKQEV